MKIIYLCIIQTHLSNSVTSFCFLLFHMFFFFFTMLFSFSQTLLLTLLLSRHIIFISFSHPNHSSAFSISLICSCQLLCVGSCLSNQNIQTTDSLGMKAISYLLSFFFLLIPEFPIFIKTVNEILNPCSQQAFFYKPFNICSNLIVKSHEMCLCYDLVNPLRDFPQLGDYLQPPHLCTFPTSSKSPTCEWNQFLEIGRSHHFFFMWHTWSQSSKIPLLAPKTSLIFHCPIQNLFPGFKHKKSGERDCLLTDETKLEYPIQPRRRTLSLPKDMSGVSVFCTTKTSKISKCTTTSGKYVRILIHACCTGSSRQSPPFMIVYWKVIKHVKDCNISCNSIYLCVYSPYKESPIKEAFPSQPIRTKNRIKGKKRNNEVVGNKRTKKGQWQGQTRIKWKKWREIGTRLITHVQGMYIPPKKDCFLRVREGERDGCNILPAPWKRGNTRGNSGAA
ncbi:hypothetical protein VP01_1742g1 [Puccinia sorghi]|uniref:Uncharacterized protein n=1 Tax=Puccinia sorghi TaxID=27349 RepID=A0A0L6VF35_9BASI|nr:hypothetical protein VP01_1742g1 [Puccinia sorghi]